MSLVFNDKNEQAFQLILAKFPPDRKKAALLPTLHLAQSQFGWLSDEVQVYIAERLELAASEVMNTVTFYTMFAKKPVGKYHVQVCTNLSCYLRGADKLMALCERELGIECGQTSEDGRFTLSHVECLASCGTAPMMQVNDDYHENLTATSATALLDGWKGEEA